MNDDSLILTMKNEKIEVLNVLKTPRSLRFIELFNGMFKSRYAFQICDWDAEDRKQIFE